MKQVSCEVMMMCLAINIRKLFSIYNKERIESIYWKADENTIIDSLPKPK